MNRDLIIFVYLGTFPVITGALAALLIFVMRWLTSTECPHCFRRIPKEALKRGVICPDCGVELATSNASVINDNAQPLCYICESSNGCIKLWDGETYCRACIADQGSGLLNAAGANQLAEELPYSISAVTLRVFLFMFAAIAGFASLISILVAIADRWQEAIGGFAVIVVIGSPVIVLFTGGAAYQFHLMRLKVIAWNGQLIVRIGTHLLVAPLAECSWREGKVSQMTVFNWAFLLRGRALIVELPKGVTSQGNLVAVGFTSETLDQWKSFFTIAGIPQTPPRTSWWSRK